MKKIAFVICSMEGGGAQRVITVLSRYFVNKGYKVTIISTSTAQLDYELEPAVSYEPIIVTSKLIGLKQAERFCRLYRKLKKQNNDYIVAFLPTTCIYIAACMQLGLDGKYIASERMDPNQDPANPLLRKLRDHAYAVASGLVFQTEDAKNSFSKQIQDKSTIIANPINESLPEPYFGPKEKRIIAASRLDKQKNIKMLIDAFSIFHKEFPDYTLEIYGQGKLQAEIADQIEQLGLGKYAFLKGFSRNIYQEMEKAAFFVLPSNYEGVSNSMLEALCLGLPVVSTDHPIGGARMYIKDGWNGFLSPVGDTEKFAQNMIKMAGSPQNLIKMQRNASLVRKQVTTRTVCQEWGNFIEGLT